MIERLNAAMNKAMANPATRDGFLKSATEPVGGMPADLARASRADYEKYSRLIKELNFKTN